MKLNIFHLCWKVIISRWWLVCFIVMSSVIVVISTVFIPIYLGECYHVFETNLFIWTPFILLCVGYLLRAIFKLVRNQLAAKLGTTVVKNARSELCKWIALSQDHDLEDDVYLNNLISYEIETINNIISYRPFVFLENLSIIIWSYIHINQQSITLLIYILPTLLAALIIGIVYGSKIKKNLKNAKDSIVKLSTLVIETIRSQKLIRTFDAVEAYENEFDKKSEDNRKWNLQIAKQSQIAIPLLEAISYITIVVAIVSSSAVVIKQNLPVSLVVTVYTYMLTMANLSSKLPENVYYFVDSFQSLNRIAKRLNNDVITSNNHYTVSCIDSVNKITFSNLKLYYKNHKLCTINYTFLKGQIIAINSASGSGKSVFADVLSGCTFEYGGTLYINNNDLATIPPHIYRRRVGYAMQKTIIFTENVINNISMGRKTSIQWQNELFQVCAINEIIDKYEQITINEETNTLSGGERQRIEIARALYTEPDIIVLDDVFTALDIKRRKTIMEFLLKHKSEHIVVIISSYKDIIEVADKVIDLSSVYESQ